MGGMIIRLRVHPNGDEKNFKRLVINLDDLTKKTEAKTTTDIVFVPYFFWWVEHR